MQKKQEKKNNSKKTALVLSSVLIVVIMLILVISVCFLYQRLTSAQDAFTTYVNSLPDYNKKPVLVFKQTEFYKYLIRGTKDPSSVHTDTLQIYLVRGTADFGFDLSQLSIDESSMNYFTRSITLYFKSNSYFPVFADITIHEDDVFEVETIVPRKYTENEAKQTAKIAGIMGSGLGALLGGSLGSVVALDPITKITGTVAGGSLGALSTGVATYFLTKNFLMTHEPAVSSASDREIMIDSAKALIALELLGSADHVTDDVTLKEWEHLLITEYEEELRRAVKDFFGRFGWKNITLVISDDSSQIETEGVLEKGEKSVLEEVISFSQGVVK